MDMTVNNNVMFFLSFFLFGFYGPFMNISLILSPLFTKGGQKLENPGKNHLTICKQNLAFPSDPSEARTSAMKNLMDSESTLLSTRLQGPATLEAGD